MLLAFHVFDVEPTWAPLERLRELADQRPDLSAPEVESYMYMGTVVTYDRNVTIHLYKHNLTRHYLNVDEAGHAYRYAGGTDDDLMSVWYEPLADLASAIEHAQGEARWMRSGLFPPGYDAA